MSPADPSLVPVRARPLETIESRASNDTPGPASPSTPGTRQPGLEQRLALGADAHDAVTVRIVMDQAIDACVLPDRKSGAGCAPCLEDFGVSPGSIGNPLQQLQCQCACRPRH